MADKFETFSAYQLGKYLNAKVPKPQQVVVAKGKGKGKNKKQVDTKDPETEKKEKEEALAKMKDPLTRPLTLKTLVRTCHVGKGQNATVCGVLRKLYPDDEEQFKFMGLDDGGKESFDESRIGEKFRIPVPKTWETTLSEKGNTPEVWEDLIESKKLPFMAMLKNLRNVIMAGVKDQTHKEILGRLKSAKQAEIDLELVMLPTEQEGDSSGSLMLKQQLTASAGPCSQRGQAWHRWNLRRSSHILLHGRKDDQPLSYIQEQSSGGVGQSLALPNCTGVVHPRPQSATMYQIKPVSNGGRLPPIEVSGTIFLHCVDQITEIIEAVPQSGPVTVVKAKDWCNWQAANNHPEWGVHTCVGIAQLLAFAVREDLNSMDTVAPQQICKKLFLAAGTVHRVDKIVELAWKASTRGAMITGPVPPSPDDPEVKQWLDESSKRTAKVRAMLQAQKNAIAAAAAAKKAVKSWKTEVHSLKAGPVFPDSADFQPMPNRQLRR